MKKVIWVTGIWFAALFAIEMLNGFVLLNLHPYEYYYTLEGFRLVFIVGSIETAIVLPLSQIYFHKLLNVDLYKKMTVKKGR